MSGDVYWFADLDHEAAEPTWRPFLQIAGACVPLEIGFHSRKECEDFILSDVLSAPLEIS